MGEEGIRARFMRDGHPIISFRFGRGLHDTHDVSRNSGVTNSFAAVTERLAKLGVVRIEAASDGNHEA